MIGLNANNISAFRYLKSLINRKLGLILTGMMHVGHVLYSVASPAFPLWGAKRGEKVRKKYKKVSP